MSKSIADDLREVIEELSQYRRNYGEVGSRDCDITDHNKRIDHLVDVIERAITMHFVKEAEFIRLRNEYDRAASQVSDYMWRDDQARFK